MFVVPEKFVRNAPHIAKHGPPVETGAWLLNYLARRLGRADLAGLDILDFGCGTRFTDTILNGNLPLNSYTGLDAWLEMINFLNAEAVPLDPRLSYYKLNMRNNYYDKAGTPPRKVTELPFPQDRTFDLACLFSVITHQNPTEATSIFRLIRKYIRPGGHMFFSADILDDVPLYREADENVPGCYSQYSYGALVQLLAMTGWQVVSFEKRENDSALILESLLCAPAPIGDTSASLGPPGCISALADVMAAITRLGQRV
ncbi:MAG: class I SAM-dependent methyltransferase [Alphaproteobacteria bacterium]|nr:class I SAM-dependent methyltransferase [Alphaproteobacteria bacterium]